MKRIIENDFLKVTIDDHGAELVSIYDKEKDREVIWQGDPKFWGRHAPVLFPNECRKALQQPLSHSRTGICFQAARICQGYGFHLH